jgi:hypothetical protein
MPKRISKFRYVQVHLYRTLQPLSHTSGTTPIHLTYVRRWSPPPPANLRNRYRRKPVRAGTVRASQASPVGVQWETVKKYARLASLQTNSLTKKQSHMLCLGDPGLFPMCRTVRPLIAPPSSLHVATNPAGTHLRGIVETHVCLVISQCLVAGQYRLVVPPTRLPRPAPRPHGWVVIDKSAYVHACIHTYATYSYNLFELHEFCTKLRIPFYINDKGISNDLGCLCV